MEKFSESPVGEPERQILDVYDPQCGLWAQCWSDDPGLELGYGVEVERNIPGESAGKVGICAYSGYMLWDPEWYPAEK